MRPIGTSARVGGAHGVDVEAMEGFAVLRACELAGVPAVEVRVVSNEIDEPDRSLWRFDDAFAALAESLPRLVAVASARVSKAAAPAPLPPETRTVGQLVAETLQLYGAAFWPSLALGLASRSSTRSRPATRPSSRRSSSRRRRR